MGLVNQVLRKLKSMVFAWNIDLHLSIQ